MSDVNLAADTVSGGNNASVPWRPVEGVALTKQRPPFGSEGYEAWRLAMLAENDELSAACQADHEGARDAAVVYFQAGLGSPLPLPRHQKFPPPRGWTGLTAPHLEHVDDLLRLWTEHPKAGNLGLRLATSVVAIDVDDYDGKSGASTIAELEKRLGPLPPAPYTSARGPGASGIRWYRLPEGVSSEGWHDPGPGVEVIRSGHRYAVVPPSWNPKSQASYAWFRPVSLDPAKPTGPGWHSPEDEQLKGPPLASDLPTLPQGWCEELATRKQLVHSGRSDGPGSQGGPQAGSSYTGPSYERLPAALRRRVDGYVDKVTQGWAERLSDAEAWPEGKRDSSGRGWEALTFQCCADLAGLAHARWTNLDETLAELTLAEVVPEAFDHAVGLDQKWAAQFSRVSPKPPPEWLRVALKDAAGGAPQVEEHKAGRVAKGATAASQQLTQRQDWAALKAEEDRDRVDDDLDRELDTTDGAAAQRFAVRHRDSLRWVPETGWHRWTGRLWGPTHPADVTKLVLDLTQDEVSRALVSGGTLRELKPWVKRLDRPRLEAVRELAHGLPEIRSEVADFDRHRDLLTVGNGTLDLSTGEVGPFDPELMLTRGTTVPYVPSATHPDWDAALACLPPDVGDWLQVRLGQAATGHVPDDAVMCLLYGGGSNGKSTLLDTLREVLDEVATMGTAQLLVRDERDPLFPLMTLLGARLVIIEELPQGARLGDKAVKDLSGPAKVRARQLYSPEFEWDATHAVLVTSNHLPRILGSDDGTWRRLAMVTFPYRYRRPDEQLESERDRKGDPGLKSRLVAGADGQHEAVLAWLAEGARRWYEAGRVMPPAPQSVRQATEAWRRDCDPTLSFIEDTVVFDPDRHVASSDLYSEYRVWAESHGHGVASDQSFSRLFGEHPVAVTKGVVKARLRRNSGLSRPVRPSLPIGDQYKAWRGLRFREESPGV